MSYFVSIGIGAAVGFLAGWLFGSRHAYKRMMGRIKLDLNGLIKRDVQ